MALPLFMVMLMVTSFLSGGLFGKETPGGTETFRVPPRARTVFLNKSPERVPLRRVFRMGTHRNQGGSHVQPLPPPGNPATAASRTPRGLHVHARRGDGG